MDERYEIRSKIGQGGIGSVYRAFDTRMSREVAIKRILHSVADADLLVEATKQISKEAGALASLQHPHIVTIHDVGHDEDGPYVVMELINGKTLDELIQRAPLTWHDFRELAMQTLEALIAAQDIDMVHSDLKPSNIMLAWLPSGKFQVKIVDFGLATLAQSQTKEELEALEAVFGSIYFMPPEQFERTPLDTRSDMYSIGCCFYQALAGSFPFNGTTGAEVMTAHLRHTVIPLQEHRDDIPRWAADWVMWHINRLPVDRPENAREALANFIQNDINPPPAPMADQPKRPRLIIPGIDPQPPQKIIHSNPPEQPASESTGDEIPATPDVSNQAEATVHDSEPAVQIAKAKPAAPILLRKTSVSKQPELDLGSSPPKPEPQTEEQAPPPAPEPEVPASANLSKSDITPLPTAAESTSSAEEQSTVETPPTKTAPQPLLPPEGSKPSIHTSTHEVPLPGVNEKPKKRNKIINTPATAKPVTRESAKAPINHTARITLAALLTLAVMLIGWFFIGVLKKNKAAKLYNDIIKEAGQVTNKEISIDRKGLDILLGTAVSLQQNTQRPTIYRALAIAKAKDGTDIDAAILNFATTTDMRPEIRAALIGDVLRLRANPAIVPGLIAYAGKTDDPKVAVASLRAIRKLVTETQFADTLNFINVASQDELRKAAEENAAMIISQSGNPAALATRIDEARMQTSSVAAKQSYLRLLGRCGGEAALEAVKGALASDSRIDQTVALTALATWGDPNGFPLLIDFLDTNKDTTLRDEAFRSAYKYITSKKPFSNEEKLELAWSDLSSIARLRGEQIQIIQALSDRDEPWALAILDKYSKSEDERVVERAMKALNQIEDRKDRAKDE